MLRVEVSVADDVDYLVMGCYTIQTLRVKKNKCVFWYYSINLSCPACR
jgi:hypothetical protein